MTRRGVIGLGVVLLLVAVGVGVARTRADAPDVCGAEVTSLSAAQSRTPFLDAAGRREQPDADRDSAVRSLDTGALGSVVGAVGYHYEQWAQLSAYAQGIGVRTRNNPDFTMLDDQTLRPRWSVQVDAPRSTYDADDSTYLVATMPRAGAPDLVALDADTGKRRWCASLGGPHVGADDPFATQLLDDGGAVVLGPGTSGRERVVRLDDRGAETWTSEVDADKGDFLGLAGDGLLVMGGRAAFELSDQPSLVGSTSRLVALRLGDGRRAWQTPELADSGSHVVGTENGLTFLLLRTAYRGDEEIVAFDEEGTAVWSVHPELTAPLDVALRGGRVLVRQGNRLVAYEAGTARPLWRLTLPSSPQLLPYGFTLADVPLLDDQHALLATTTGLRALDLATGRFTGTAPLPTDGVNTTYWPYQVAVSPQLIAVATNTSALLLRRP